MEHLVFPSVLLFWFYITLNKSLHFHVVLFFLTIALLLGAGLSVIGNIFPKNSPLATSQLNMGIRLFLPAFIIGAMTFIRTSKSQILISTTKTIVCISACASLIALSSIFFDLSFFLNYFIKSDENSVWTQAFSLGRFTGIFNQPLEAGIFFSIALLSIVYLMSIKWWSFPGQMLLMIMIVIGGSLSLSKNFILLGVFISFLYAASIRMLSISSGLLFITIFLIIALFYILFGNQDYINSFVQLFNEGGFLMAITAGRLGSSQTEVGQLWRHLFQSGDWFSGAGLGSYLPLDNGYLEYFYQGGILPLICYLIFIIAIISHSMSNWKNDEAKLLFFLGLYIIFASLGGPVITANRANVPALMLIAACILHISYYKNIKV